MKICSIGNSFSRYAHKLTKANDIEFETANLYIGGCGMETPKKELKKSMENFIPYTKMIMAK